MPAAPGALTSEERQLTIACRRIIGDVQTICGIRFVCIAGRVFRNSLAPHCGSEEGTVPEAVGTG